MNFHSKNWQRCQALENSKNSIGSRNPRWKIQRNEPLLFRKQKARVSSERKQTFQHESLILAQDERWRRA